MAYGDSLGVTAPVVGTTAGPDYADQVNEFLEALQDVVEAKVTPAGIDINTDLSLFSSGSYYRLKDALAVTFRDQTSALSAATYPTSIYFSGGECYANDGAGNQIQLTAGGIVNTSTTGGITGSGYGTSGVELAWDSGNQAYNLWANSTTTTYADVVLDDVKLYDGSSNFITLSAPSIVSDYTITFPTAVPASTSVVQMAATGTLSASPSANITTTGTVSAGTATVTGALTVGAGAAITGNLSATGSMLGSSLSTVGALSVGTNLTVSGTATVTGTTTLSGNATVGGTLTITGSATSPNDRILNVSGAAFHPELETDTYSKLGAVLACNRNNAVFYYVIQLPVNAVIRQVDWYATHGVSGVDREYQLGYVELVGGSFNDIETDTIATSGSSVTPSTTTDTTLISTRAYALRWKAQDVDTLIGVSITYDGVLA